jgi:NAD(P)-dependent dehydrogenase (short-subunit alcohol dehydrogenase family)
MAQTPRRGPSHDSWTSKLSIDLIVRVLNTTILHPFAASMIPLSLLAQAYPLRSVSVLATIAWAVLVASLALFHRINQRIAHGKPREVDLEEEVIVITGGASGLGLLIAEIYAMRGASVAVLDVRPLEGSEARNISYYYCDVSNSDQIAKVAEQIREDLGTPTIVMNNAGIVLGKRLWELEVRDIDRSLGVNLLGPFYILREFLPRMVALGRGTVVTVSSVIGVVSAARLTEYSAAKAGLIAMHTALTAELQPYPGIKTILVTPGQLTTPLFEGVKTNSFFAPVVEPFEVAREVVRTIDEGRAGHIAMPLYARWAGWLNVLPAGVQKLGRWVSGVDEGMRGYKAGSKSE